MWSRYPITQSSTAPGYSFEIVLTRVAVPGLATQPTFVGAHMAGPVPSARDWSHDIDAFPATLRALTAANPSGPIIVGGDFNATWDTAQFRRLLRDGYGDAAEQSGSGYTRSYRADVWYGPFIAIDQSEPQCGGDLGAHDHDHGIGPPRPAHPPGPEQIRRVVYPCGT